MSCSLLTPSFVPLVVLPMVMSFVVFPTSAPSVISPMEGTAVVYLIVCTIVGIALSIVGTIDGSTLPLIIFYALKSMPSCSIFTLELEALSSSTIFFFLKTLLREYAATFFLFSSVVYFSSLVLLTLASGFYGLSFLCTNKY